MTGLSCFWRPTWTDLRSPPRQLEPGERWGSTFHSTPDHRKFASARTHVARVVVERVVVGETDLRGPAGEVQARDVGRRSSSLRFVGLPARGTHAWGRARGPPALPDECDLGRAGEARPRGRRARVPVPQANELHLRGARPEGMGRLPRARSHRGATSRSRPVARRPRLRDLAAEREATRSSTRRVPALLSWRCAPRRSSRRTRRSSRCTLSGPGASVWRGHRRCPRCGARGKRRALRNRRRRVRPGARQGD